MTNARDFEACTALERLMPHRIILSRRSGRYAVFAALNSAVAEWTHKAPAATCSRAAASVPSPDVHSLPDLLSPVRRLGA